MENKQDKKILWLTNLPAPYRFPIWDNLANYYKLKVVFLLKQKNWRNWVVPENQTWESRFLGLHSINLGDFDLIPSFRGYRKLISKFDFVIIGGWEAPMYISSILIAKKRKIPVIQFYESFSETHRFKKGVIAKFRKWILTKPDRYITISSKSTAALINLEVSPSDILTLFNCVDGELYNELVKKKLISKSSGHQFIYVGQLIKRKNLQNVVSAFSMIRKELDTLVIAGVGPLESEIKALVEMLGLTQKVFFTGYLELEELADLYSRSHTLILASTNEVWGLVVNEALASGMHVVVSENCGVADLVRNMRGVEICKSDVDSISRALVRSRKNYTGMIQNPEILKYSPSAFVSELIAFINS